MTKPVTTTSRDLELLVLAWQSLKTPPQVDYTIFAQKAGYKNAATAAVQFGTLKKKVFALAARAGENGRDGAGISSGPSTPDTPKTAGRRSGTPGSKRKAGKTTQGNASAKDEGEDEDTPSKKARGGDRVKKEEGEEGEVEGEEREEGTTTTKVKTEC